MKKRSILFCSALVLFVLFSTVSTWAGTAADTAWVRTYSGPGYNWEIAYAITLDGSGNICVTGFSQDAATDDDYATVKYYPNGNTAWVKRYNSPGNGGDRAYALVTDDLDNVYVTGRSAGAGTYLDFATIKYQANGDTAWVRRYNGPADSTDEARAIAVDASGNVYVTGYSYGGATDFDYLTIKYDSNGDTGWVRRYNGPANQSDRAYAVEVDGDGGVLVFGQSKGIGSDYDFLTIKYLPDGDTAWVRRYNGPGDGYDRASAMVVDDSDNVYVTGSTLGGSTGWDFLTMKYFPGGDTAWARIYDGPTGGWDAAYAIAVGPSGNTYVTGESDDEGTFGDYTTIKYDQFGDTVWVRRYNGPGNLVDYPYSIALDSYENVYVTGESGADYLTIKYSSDGNPEWIEAYDGPANSGDGAEALVVDGSQNVYVTGSSDGTGMGNYDYATIKYVQFLIGDANGDGIIDLGDVVHSINYVYKSGSPPEPLAAGDANCDGVVDLGDVVYLLNHLFKGWPPPSC